MRRGKILTLRGLVEKQETSMTAIAIKRVDTAVSTDAAMEIIDHDGAVILSNLLDGKQYRALRSELDPEFAQADFCQGLFYGEKTKRIHSLARKSETTRAMIMMPPVVAIMNRVLGPNCNQIQLNLTQGIQIWPGEKAQVIHRDDSMFPIKHKPFEFMVNAMWAYGEFTRDNGATIVVPGSHKWDPDRVPAESEITQAEMLPGEVLIYLGSLIHAGGQNRSHLPRTGIALSYCLGWIRQSENQYFAAPPDIAKHFSKDLQDMLGYSVQRPNLGMYEGVEPRILFEEKPDRIITRDWLTPDQTEQLRRYHAGEDILAA
jgi:ectoine hydroxylase-related dioxygenase (phytanoyl-CoA dioxygenase family)